MGKNDDAWKILFDKLEIARRVETEGLVKVSAKQIKEIGGREPRLMAKFDNSQVLPIPFRKHQLGILPVSRSEYVIGRFNLFHDFPKTAGSVRPAQLPEHLTAFDSAPSSEAIVLHQAHAAGILADFLGEPKVDAVVSGRMGSDTMRFTVADESGRNQQVVEVTGAQIEIDGGYEGPNSLALVEAKRDLSDDFVVRQLFFPWYVWSKRVRKTVRPVYLVHGSGLFHLMEYEFEDPTNYSSIRLVKNCTYYLPDAILPTATVEMLAEHAVVVPQPPVTFPQADRMERVIAVCELLLGEDLTAPEIAEELGFVERQANYYAAAGRFLGYIENRRGVMCLTPRGKRVFELQLQERTTQIVSDVLKNSVLLATWRLWEKSGEKPTSQEVVTIMEASKVHDGNGKRLGPVTMNRRAQTVLAWVGWLRSLDAPAQLASQDY